MFAFTKQEQRFLLFLVATFLIGFCVKIVRSRIAEKPDGSWEKERQKIITDFRKKSQQLGEMDSTARQAEKEKIGITKKSLTEKININTATSEELQILPRIGPVTAERIITFRNENGPFAVIEDIQKVKNIGPKTFENIKEYITVE